ADIGLAQQQLRGLAVRQGTRELRRLGPASDQRRDESLLLQVGIVRACCECVEKLRGSRLCIGLTHSEPAGEVLAEYAGQGVPAGGSARSPSGRWIGCRAGGQQRDGEKKRAADRADLLHSPSLRHAKG